MGRLITNGNAFSGTSINVNDNLTNLAIGDKLLVDMGIINPVILGNWNRLIAGSSTIIYLGTKMNLRIANATNVIYGYSYQYNKSTQIVLDNNHTYALNKLNLYGGTTSAELEQRVNEDNQTRLILYKIIAIYLVTISFSLINIQWPAFNNDNNNENNEITFDPSTGEIINVDNYGISTSPQLISATIINAFGIILIFVIQLLQAKKIATDITKSPTISHLQLDNSNLLALVFSNPSIVNDYNEYITTIPNNSEQNNSKPPSSIERSGCAKLHMQGEEHIVLSSVNNDPTIYSSIHVKNDLIHLDNCYQNYQTSVFINSINDTNHILIDNSSHDLYSGNALIDQDYTLIHRNDGKAIDICLEYEQHDSKTKLYLQNSEPQPTPVMLDGEESDEDISSINPKYSRILVVINQDHNQASQKQTTNQQIIQHQKALSNLRIETDLTSLSTTLARLVVCGDTTKIIIKNQIVAQFNDQRILFGSLQYEKKTCTTSIGTNFSASSDNHLGIPTRPMPEFINVEVRQNSSAEKIAYLINQCRENIKTLNTEKIHDIN